MKVSIIIPVYNMEHNLNKCLDSVIGQTYKDIEIIAINDGSTDNSLNILNDYAKKDSRIIVINQENGGISKARNAGLEISKGEYICFVDSDDYVEENMVSDLLNECITKQADIVVCDYYKTDGNNKEIARVGYQELFGMDLRTNPRMIVDIDYAPWNKIYKKELFNGLRFPLNTKYEDFETILKVFSKARKIVKLDKPLYDYYINPDGETRKQTKKNMDMLNIAVNLNEYFDFENEDKSLKEYFFETVSEKLLHSASTLFKIASRKETLKYINDVYKFLNDNCPNWKKIYMSNKFDSKYIKFVRGHKFVFKTYAWLRINLFKLIGR